MKKNVNNIDLRPYEEFPLDSSSGPNQYINNRNKKNEKKSKW